MYTNPRTGWTMHCSGQKFARLLKNSWSRDGQMHCENFIPAKKFTRSGIISEMLTAAMQVCVLIISFSARILISVFLPQVSTAMFADGKNRVIMLRLGLN